MTLDLTPAERRRAADLFATPLSFAEDVLGAQVWPHQRPLLEAVATGQRRCAVKACHASGKTWLIGGVLALWWLLRWRDGIVITTAPTHAQVQESLWGELRAAARRCPLPLRPPNLASWRLGPRNFALGIASKDAHRVAGYHEGHVLILVDEAPGVPEGVYQALAGLEAGGEVTTVLIGNPLAYAGQFAEAFGAEQHLWWTQTISAWETPNLAGLDAEALLALSDAELDDNPAPKLVTRRWVRERLELWGEGHPQWQARVLGQFPDVVEGLLIQPGWLERAARPAERPPEGRVSVGLDVAGEGDAETVLVAVDRTATDAAVLAVRHTVEADARGWCVRELRQWERHGWLSEPIRVDVIGEGSYLARHLQDAGFRVERVRVGDPAIDGETYKNLRAELYGTVADRLREGRLSGLTDRVLRSQLARVPYHYDSRGRLQLQAKDDMRRAGIPSPDRADALVLALKPRAPRSRILTGARKG